MNPHQPGDVLPFSLFEYKIRAKRDGKRAASIPQDNQPAQMKSVTHREQRRRSRISHSRRTTAPCSAMFRLQQITRLSKTSETTCPQTTTLLEENSLTTLLTISPASYTRGIWNAGIMSTRSLIPGRLDNRMAVLCIRKNLGILTCIFFFFASLFRGRPSWTLTSPLSRAPDVVEQH